MSTTIDEFSDDGLSLDRYFLGFSSKFEEPLYWAYGMLRYRLVSVLDPNKFDNATSKVKEVAKRIWIAACAAAAFIFAGTHLLISAVVLAATCKVLRSIGFVFQKEGYTHVKGNDAEKSLKEGELSAMTWDIRGQRGGIHYAKGGVVHWRSRVDQIVEKVRGEDPDVLVLQEIDDPAFAETLIARLKDQYAHFFIHFKGGGMVATKCAVHDFTYTGFMNDSRGFETLEIKSDSTDLAPCIRIIGSHLPVSAEDREKRIDRFSQIVNSLEKKQEILPTLFVGNVSRDREHPDEEVSLSKYLYHSYREEVPTHTGELLAQWNPKLKEADGVDDFVSLFRRNLSDGRTLPVIEKGIRLLDSHLVKAFDETYNTQTALSDHHAVVAKISGLTR